METNGVKILSTGSYLPKKIVTNSELNTNDEWVKENLGIFERRVAEEQELTSDLATKAAIDAIKRCNLSINDIDMIIIATATPDAKAPSTASIVQQKLRAYNSFVFDISAVCAGYVFAMSVAYQYISSGFCKNVLVIGADTFSKVTDWERRDAVFFGDGAGAAILSKSNTRGFLAFDLNSDSRDNGFVIENNAKYFEMDGRLVYDTATKVLPESVRTVLKKARLSKDDIDLVVPHQPSIKTLKEVFRKAGIPFEKVMTNMDKCANTVGGTVPILLDKINKDGRIKKGDIILFAAIGSGWSWGSSLLRWN